jgi:nucleoid-associated protein EbfC
MLDMKQLQKMQKELHERMERMQEDLKGQTVEASSGGGMVSAVVNGNQEVISITIKPEAVDPEDLEMLQDLVVAALNNAIEKSKELNQGEMSKITGGLKLPGF